MLRKFCFVVVLVILCSCCCGLCESNEADDKYAQPIEVELLDDTVERDGCCGNLLFCYPNTFKYNLSGSASKDMSDSSYMFVISEDVHKMFTFMYIDLSYEDGEESEAEIFDQYADATMYAGIKSFSGEIDEEINGRFLERPARLISYTTSLGGVTHKHKSFGLYTGSGLAFIMLDYESSAIDDLDSEFDALMGSFQIVEPEEMDFSKYNKELVSFGAVE